MDHYHIWCDLKDGVRDMDFVKAVNEMLGFLKAQGKLDSFAVQRRKLGFGPEAIGEWHVDIVTKDLAQLDEAFQYVTPRAGEMEKLHAAVWSRVVNFKSGLYRDFPDANRRAN